MRKQYTVDYQNEKELINLCIAKNYNFIQSNELYESIKKYLKDNNLEIVITPCYDSQSGWHGQSVYLEGVDLSGNGYCYHPDNLKNHINTFKRQEELKQTEEYKEYLRLKEKFKDIKQ